MIIDTAARAERTAHRRGSGSLVLAATAVLLPEELFDAVLRLLQNCQVDRLLASNSFFCCHSHFRTRRQRRSSFNKSLPERSSHFLVNCWHADQASTGEQARVFWEPAEGVELVESEIAVDLDVGCMVGPVVVDEFPDELFGVPDGEGVLAWGWELGGWERGGRGGAVG